MQRDLVDERGWITEQDYKEGLARAQLAPGPLAAQLAMYLGWVVGGVRGATLVGLAFVLPSFLMVLALSAAYLSLGGLAWIQSLFYGMGAAVIAVIARSAAKLAGMTLKRDPLLWALFTGSALVTAVTESEIVWVFVAAGLAGLAVRGRRPGGAGTLCAATWPVWLVTGLAGPASGSTLVTIGWYFAEAGAFVFGSGLAIVPFLHAGVVDRYHWLTERQFLDAVAVAMITPGPVVITVAFIGYLVAGPAGAVVASLGVFLPCWLFVIIPAPCFRRFADDVRIKAFVDGVTAAATGAIAGAGWVLGRRSLVDATSIAIAVVTLVILIRSRRIPEPVVVLAAGVAGLALGGAGGR